MKTLLFPTIQIKSKKVAINPISVYATIVLLICLSLFAYLVFNGQYVFALLLTGATIVGVLLYRTYQEVANIDLSTGDIDLTLEEIIEELDY